MASMEIRNTMTVNSFSAVILIKAFNIGVGKQSGFD